MRSFKYIAWLKIFMSHLTNLTDQLQVKWVTTATVQYLNQDLSTPTWRACHTPAKPMASTPTTSASYGAPMTWMGRMGTIPPNHSKLFLLISGCKLKEMFLNQVRQIVDQKYNRWTGMKTNQRTIFQGKKYILGTIRVHLLVQFECNPIYHQMKNYKSEKKWKRIKIFHKLSIQLSI